MHRERLQHLITVMQGVQDRIDAGTLPGAFDMNDWVAKDECGTAACVAGWAALDPEFQAQGLAPAYLDPTTNQWVKDTDLEVGYRNGWLVRWFHPSGHVYDEETFFELEGRMSYHLFYGGSYDVPKPQPKDVIKRIKQMLAKEDAKA